MTLNKRGRNTVSQNAFRRSTLSSCRKVTTMSSQHRNKNCFSKNPAFYKTSTQNSFKVPLEIVEKETVHTQNFEELAKIRNSQMVSSPLSMSKNNIDEWTKKMSKTPRNLDANTNHQNTKGLTNFQLLRMSRNSGLYREFGTSRGKALICDFLKSIISASFDLKMIVFVIRCRDMCKVAISKTALQPDLSKNIDKD